jgi:uncharacterized membrane protein YkvA (DUF1232 family)
MKPAMLCCWRPLRLLTAIVHSPRTARLVWRLLRDPRVAAWPKLLIAAVAVYIVSPVDLVPDLVPLLGQMDDLGVLMLGVQTFLRLCPEEAVSTARGEAPSGTGLPGAGEALSR